MDPGRRISRTGLLIMKRITFRITLIFSLLIIPYILPAQDTEAAMLQVFTSASPETPAVGYPWTLTILINHPVPEDITVIPPPFAGFLSLDRLTKAPRVTETQVQTLIQYRFIPIYSGRFFLESFTVVSPKGITETVPFILNISAEGEEQRTPTMRMIWEEAPRQMAAGERITFALRANGWNSQQPPPEFFMPDVPQGVILSPAPLSAEERTSGIALKLSLIPISAGDFHLSARTLQYENIRFEIPAVQIRITDLVSAGDDQQPQDGADRETSIENASSVVRALFPNFILSSAEKLNAKKKSQCEKIYNTARELWDRGRRAEALAELRRNEKNHPAGALLVQIRRQAEENLGIFNTTNENRQFRKIFSGLSSSNLFLIIIAPFVCLVLLKRNSSRRKIILLCAIIFAMLASLSLYRIFDSRFIFPWKSDKFGVTNGTPVYKTADTEAEELFRFNEGHPVVIILRSDSWVYVKANDAAGLSGWVPAGTIEFY